MNKFFKIYWPLLPALSIYSYFANKLNITQDDAFITYRYIANYLNGNGLVYNIGERIEGFTNFGWTIYLTLFGVLGLDFITISKISGFLLGGGVVCLTYLIGRYLFEKNNNWFAIAATILVAMNQSLSHWSPAGLETAAFAFLAMLSLLLYLKRSWLLIFTLVLAVWTRPEGAVLTGILIIIETIERKGIPGYSLSCAVVAFILSLPFVGFKLFYYGSILPNPFYAKTSFDLNQLANGFEYVARFFSHYGFYGIGLIVPLLFYKHLTRVSWAVWLYMTIYVVYIFFIGGDVLKVHRFFLPLFGPSALLLMFALWLPVRSMNQANRYLALFVAMVILVPLTYTLPFDFVKKYNVGEMTFTGKMKFKAERLLESDSTDFSVALPTIGIFGYELLGHEIIDMLGLTDSTIARYSEEPIPRMETTWKEQKHNSRYLLERAPDYIMFSTGIKPSAPAERALLLYRQFMDCYRTVGWQYTSPSNPARKVISSVFKKRKPITGNIVPVYPVEYVQEYKQALDAHTRNDHVTAIQHYDRAARASPRPYYVYLVYQKAFSLMMLQKYDIAMPMMDSLVARDSTLFEPHMDLYRWSIYLNDLEKAAIHKRWLQKLVPWYWPIVKEQAERLLKNSQGRRNNPQKRN